MKAAAILALAMAASLLLACDGTTPDPCTKPDEVIHLKVDGACPGFPQMVKLVRHGCGIEIMGFMETGLPRFGQVPQDERPIRQGGWQLYGAIRPATGAPIDVFRRCKAARLDWRLEVACIDGHGQPACDATLTE